MMLMEMMMIRFMFSSSCHTKVAMILPSPYPSPIKREGLFWVAMITFTLSFPDLL
jgi:hypothetical protein